MATRVLHGTHSFLLPLEEYRARMLPVKFHRNPSVGLSEIGFFVIANMIFGTNEGIAIALSGLKASRANNQNW